MAKPKPQKSLIGRGWDRAKFPLLVTGLSAGGMIANEYIMPQIVADNAGIIQKKIGEWGYAALPWIERFVVDGALGATAYRSIENMVSHDTSGIFSRANKWFKRGAIIGALSAVAIAAFPYLVGKTPITYVSKKPTDTRAQIIARQSIEQSITKLTSTEIKYRERATNKPVTYKEDLEKRVRGALAHRDIHYAAYEAALKAYPALKDYPTFSPTLTLATEVQESGGQERIKSRAGARGPMQFMPGTAREEGLTVNRFIDERVDPKKSIPAAVYLLARYVLEYESVETALAAYNAGPNKTKRIIRRQGTSNFWRIMQDFKPETQDYVPYILATVDLMNNPTQYGLPIGYPLKIPS